MFWLLLIPVVLLFFMLIPRVLRRANRAIFDQLIAIYETPGEAAGEEMMPPGQTPRRLGRHDPEVLETRAGSLREARIK